MGKDFKGNDDYMAGVTIALRDLSALQLLEGTAALGLLWQEGDGYPARLTQGGVGSTGRTSFASYTSGGGGVSSRGVSRASSSAGGSMVSGFLDTLRDA